MYYVELFMVVFSTFPMTFAMNRDNGVKYIRVLYEGVQPPHTPAYLLCEDAQR